MCTLQSPFVPRGDAGRVARRRAETQASQQGEAQSRSQYPGTPPACEQSAALFATIALEGRALLVSSLHGLAAPGAGGTRVSERITRAETCALLDGLPH